MLAYASQISDDVKENSFSAGAQHSPTNLPKGSEWIVSTLGDLVNYCAFNQLNDVEATLRRALWEASLQLEQADQKGPF